MKKIFALIVLLFAVVYQASAMPAYPKPVKYQLPDGTSITVRIYGDEFLSYMLTTDGYQVTSLEDGFLYYYVPGVGTRGVESMRVSEPARRTAEERRYISTLRGGVDQTYLNVGQMLANERRASMRVNNVNEFAPFTSQSSKTAATRALASRSLVILCQYQDKSFLATSTRNYFDNMLNQKGFNVNGAVGSANDYFRENSFDAYNPRFDVSPIVTLSRNMSYYGATKGNESDVRPREMIREACELAAAAGVDFSQYDSDGDGVADDVFVFYAGHNQAEGGSANSIWPHRWYLQINSKDDLSITLNGVLVDGYACTSELRGSNGTTNSGIGTFCHEFGHVLGLPDFYDADYTNNGLTVGLYNSCIMSSGGYNGEGNIPPYYTGIERNMVGWNTMKDLKDAEDNLAIYPINTKAGNDVWKIETGNPGEYFYLEARQATGWDQTLTDEGLLIYQIDRSQNLISNISAERLWQSNSLNVFSSHPCARVIESGGKTTADGNFGAMFYPGANRVTSFLPGSPGFSPWKGGFLPIGLAGISQSNGTVSLRVVRELDLCTLQGKVVDADGIAVPAVKISVIEVQEPAAQNSRLKLVSGPAPGVSSRVADVVYTATTDISGKYILPNLPWAKYDIIVECDGYDSYMETIDLSEKKHTLDVTLNRFIPTLLSQKTWASAKTAGYLDQSKSFWVASKWIGNDLTEVIGKNIGGIAVETGSLTTYEARIVINNQVKYRVKGTTSKGGLTIVYLPSTIDLQIPAAEPVRVEFKVEAGTSSIAVDAGPLYDNGSRNEFSEDGSTWVTLASKGIQANLKMSLLYKKDTDIPDVPSAVAVPSQRACEVQFSSTDGNITVWNLRYKPTAGGEWKEVNNIKATSYILTTLMPETSYDAELIATFGGKKSAAKAFQFATTGLTAKFAAIGGVKSRYAVGESYTLQCVNVQTDVESIEWRWQNGLLRTEALLFASSGKGRLDCIITYKDGSKETLSREIVIQ